MICALHALLGAALGKSQKKPQAFLTGILSHFFADLVPHRDFSPELETLLVLGTLAGIGAGKGWGSPAFWGAVGGALPDLENGLAYCQRQGRLVFPTHTGLHGAKVTELYSQLGLALICLALLLAPEAGKVGLKESTAETAAALP
jgi:hypothetical protein